MVRKLIFLCLLSCLGTAKAQVIDAAYVKSLYQQYPTQKSGFCRACKLWINPYYKSIADTAQHRPLVTYYVYTKAHRLQQEAMKVPRTGIYAAWHPAYRQPDETKVYKQANTQSADMIAKGHCQAWILLAYDINGAILSDTYTFNAGMEHQGQNIGTELATEELTRKLTHQTDSVKIWCGTYGSQQTYTQNNLTITMPVYYYKIIQYREQATGGQVTQCYWLPNQPAEKRALLQQRMIDHAALVHNLDFDPQQVLN